MNEFAPFFFLPVQINTGVTISPTVQSPEREESPWSICTIYFDLHYVMASKHNSMCLQSEGRALVSHISILDPTGYFSEDHFYIC